MTSSRENGRLIGSFSPVMTGLYSGGTVPENRGSLVSSRKLSTNSTNSVALNCDCLVLVSVLIYLQNSLGFVVFSFRISEWNFLVYNFFVFDTFFLIVLRVREITGTVDYIHVLYILYIPVEFAGLIKSAFMFV